MRAVQDDVYSSCDAVDWFNTTTGTEVAVTWEEVKAVLKTQVEEYGCDNAAQAMPAFVLVTAVTEALWARVCARLTFSPLLRSSVSSPDVTKN